MSKYVNWCVFVFIALILIILDLLLKQWAAASIPGRGPVVLVPGVLGLTFLRNPGAAFGLLAGFEWGRTVLSISSALLMVAIVWYYSKIPSGKKYWFIRVPIILIFAGGLGNLIDRLMFGYVRDMLEFLFIRFAIFNLADVYVTVGVFGFAVFGLFVVKDIPLFNE